MNPAGQPDPATQYGQLKSAIMGAQQAGGASPLGNFPELNKLYTDTYPIQQQSQQVAGSAYNAQVEDANQKAAAAASLANQKAMLDPSKYQQVPLSDGGYKFLAPNGQEISAAQFSQITGQSPDKVLSQSQNPIDIGFVNDYKNLQSYINSKLNSKNDDTAAQNAQQIEAIVKKTQGVDLSKMNIQDVIDRFKQAYPTVFGGNQPGVQAGQTFIPPTSTTAGNVTAGL